MTWENKHRLIKEDSATVVRYFNNRYLQFFNQTISQDMNLLNEVQYIYIGLHIWKMHQSMARQMITQLPGFMLISSPVHQMFQRHISSTYSIGFIDTQGNVT